VPRRVLSKCRWLFFSTYNMKFPPPIAIQYIVIHICVDFRVVHWVNQHI
jgi:hypothetical protein